MISFKRFHSIGSLSGEKLIKAARSVVLINNAIPINTISVRDHESRCLNPYDDLHVVYILMRDNDRHRRPACAVVDS